jgi:hypothetical protein
MPEISTIIIVAVQVGTTTALVMLFKQIVKKLDVLNGRVYQHEVDLRNHVEQCPTRNK